MYTTLYYVSREKVWAKRILFTCLYKSRKMYNIVAGYRGATGCDPLHQNTIRVLVEAQIVLKKVRYWCSFSYHAQYLTSVIYLYFSCVFSSWFAGLRKKNGSSYILSITFLYFLLWILSKGTTILGIMVLLSLWYTMRKYLNV